ncbi:MAG: aminoacyl-tRNA hydrolase [Aureispira sp.]|nr:aminoacyl-tRNA hydrolase [Aureispira sp.]
MFKFFFRKKREAIAQQEKAEAAVKYLIVGLGNMGPDYDGTRHNVGFDVVDYIAAKHKVEFEDLRYGFVGRFKHKGRIYVLVKPNTYMNRSGQAIRYWLQKEKLSIEHLMVILDDLNLNFGRVRIKTKGGAGGHNGLKNIEELLATNQYPRLRIGIGDQYSKGRQVDFVLGKWSKEEEELLPKIIKHAAGAVLSFGAIGLARTMNQFNKKGFQLPKKEDPSPSEDDKS